MVQIRKLEPRDAAALNRLTQQALRDHPTAFTTAYEEVAGRSNRAVADHLREVGRGRGFRLGAFDDAGDLVGNIRLNPRVGARMAHAADLVFLYVRADRQGAGIGRSLVARTVEMAREIDGLRQLELMVSSDSHAARRLYERIGFSATGCLKDQIRVAGQFYDLIPMWMSLLDRP